MNCATDPTSSLGSLDCALERADVIDRATLWKKTMNKIRHEVNLRAAEDFWVNDSDNRKLSSRAH